MHRKRPRARLRSWAGGFWSSKGENAFFIVDNFFGGRDTRPDRRRKALERAWHVQSACGGRPAHGLSYKHLLAAVAVLEIVVATICFFGRSRGLAMSLVAYLCTNFMLYRAGLWWIGWKQPCGCMGSLTDALHIKPETADNLALFLLLYMLVASYALLFMQWKGRGKTLALSTALGEPAAAAQKIKSPQHQTQQ